MFQVLHFDQVLNPFGNLGLTVLAALIPIIDTVGELLGVLDGKDGIG